MPNLCHDQVVDDSHNSPEERSEQHELQLLIDPRDAGGVWANFARVSHSEHEFTLDFVRIDHTTDPSRVWWWRV